MSWFSKIKDFGNNFLSLGKRAVDWSAQTLGKASNFAHKGLKFMDSKPIKGLVRSASEFIPGIKDAYAGAKKFGHLTNNFSRMGSESIANTKSFLNSFDRRKKMKDEVSQVMPSRMKLNRKHRDETMERPRTQEEEPPEFSNAYNF